MRLRPKNTVKSVIEKLAKETAMSKAIEQAKAIIAIPSFTEEQMEEFFFYICPWPASTTIKSLSFLRDQLQTFIQCKDLKDIELRFNPLIDTGWDVSNGICVNIGKIINSYTQKHEDSEILHIIGDLSRMIYGTNYPVEGELGPYKRNENKYEGDWLETRKAFAMKTLQVVDDLMAYGSKIKG
jgi:hypothetical protein